MSRLTSLALLALALAFPGAAAAAPALVPVGGTFDQPVYAASPPQDLTRLFVVEKAGVIRVVRNGTRLAAPFLDIRSSISPGDERGLLSVAFPPDYASTRRFYVYLTAQPAGDLEIREYTAAEPDRADPASGRLVWSTPHPLGNHNGGTIQFGPDGLLWFATGDGGGQGDPDGNAQDTARPLGKVLRIAPRPGGGYDVPAGNPYGTAVWASGLRNPFRFSFDRATGDLAIGDVGGSNREEIDFARRSAGLGRAANFGWPCREGFDAGPVTCTPFAPYVEPVHDFPTSGAVTGGVVVRDPGLPTLVGRYLFVDYSQVDIRSLVLDLPRARDEKSAGLPERSLVVAFAEDACGRVYLVSLNGTVERIQDGAPGQCVPIAPITQTPSSTAAPTPAVAPARDRTAPRVSIRVARRGRVGRGATPRITLTASEACRVTVDARAGRVRLHRVRRGLRAGRRTVVRLRPSRRGARRLRRALAPGRRLTLRVAVTARDAAGNTRRAHRRLKIRRA